MCDGLAILQNLLQGLGAEYVAQSRGSQESRGVLGVLDVGDRYDRVENAKIDDGVDCDRHRVFGEYLLRRHVECDCAQVDHYDVIDAWQDKKETGPARTSR